MSVSDPDPVTVRLAVPADYARVGELTVRAYAADGFIDDEHAGYAVRLRDAAPRAEQAELFVAARRDPATGLDEVLGSVTYCPSGSPYRELAEPDEGEFRMLAVEPAARGLGVGRALVVRCLDRSREQGFQRVVICSLPEMVTAHRLYRSLGFVRDPSRDWSPAPGVTLLAFLLLLGAC